MHTDNYILIILTSKRPFAKFQKSFENNHPRT